jgi:hypothetical protein
LLDEIGEHAEQPRQRQQKRQRAKHQRQPERKLARRYVPALERPASSWTRPCWVDGRPADDERTLRARDRRARATERTSGSLEVRSAVDPAPPLKPPNQARHVTCDADDDDGVRRAAADHSGSRVRPRVRRAAGPVRPRRPATTGARRFRTRPPPRRSRFRSVCEARPRTISMPRR